jgi:hypothetical protein
MRSSGSGLTKPILTAVQTRCAGHAIPSTHRSRQLDSPAAAVVRSVPLACGLIAMEFFFFFLFALPRVSG